MQPRESVTVVAGRHTGRGYVTERLDRAGVRPVLSERISGTSGDAVVAGTLFLLRNPRDQFASILASKTPLAILLGLCDSWRSQADWPATDGEGDGIDQRALDRLLDQSPRPGPELLIEQLDLFYKIHFSLWQTGLVEGLRRAEWVLDVTLASRSDQVRDRIAHAIGQPTLFQGLRARTYRDMSLAASDGSLTRLDPRRAAAIEANVLCGLLRRAPRSNKWQKMNAQAHYAYLDDPLRHFAVPFV
jgi:hypothetical protein